jgi:hypothetical protein
MLSIEQGVATDTVVMVDMEAQLRPLAMGLTKATLTAMKSIESCHALLVSAECSLKNYDIILTMFTLARSIITSQVPICSLYGWMVTHG